MALSKARTKKEAVNLALRYYADQQDRAARIAGISSGRGAGEQWRMPSAATARTGGEYDEIVEMFTDL